MSKLLKAIATKHRPAVAERMIPANGYDEKKHTHPKDLKNAGVISAAQAKELDDCLDDLGEGGSAAANTLKNAKSSKSKEKLNDADFVKMLMDIDSDTGSDNPDDDTLTN